MVLINDEFQYMMQKAFKTVMCDQKYVDARLKRYRIFMYCYMFGSVHANDLYYVFYKDTYGLDSKKHSENINAWNALLTYLCKQEYLQRLEKGYCCLKKDGIEALYEHLCSCRMIDDADMITFKKECRIRQSLFASHSSKTGRTVLSLVRSPETSFVVEPFLDTDGKLVKVNMLENHSFVLNPDALVHDDKTGEYFYIESDSCKERLPSVLMPKFSRYADFMENNAVIPESCTILFSVWNDADKDTVLFDLYEYADFMSMFEFIDLIGAEPLSFKDYISALKSYSGVNECLGRLSCFLNNGNFTGISCKEEFFDAFKKERVHSLFTSRFVLRRKDAQACVSGVRNFRDMLLKGTRFVCLPLNAYNHLYDYILLEKESSLIMCQNLILKIFPESHFLSYEKTASFADNRTGDFFVFRNVFTFENNSTNIKVCVENISDDLGGIYRIKKYVDFQRKVSLNNVYFICLYNDLCENKIPDLLSRRDDLSSSFFLIPYSCYSPI